jgi:hypothetical protein
MFIDEKFLLTHKTKIYVSIKISTYCLLCMYDCPIWCFGATKKEKLPQVKCPKLPQHKAIRQARQTTSA